MATIKKKSRKIWELMEEALEYELTPKFDADGNRIPTSPHILKIAFTYFDVTGENGMDKVVEEFSSKAVSFIPPVKGLMLESNKSEEIVTQSRIKTLFDATGD